MFCSTSSNMCVNLNCIYSEALLRQFKAVQKSTFKKVIINMYSEILINNLKFQFLCRGDSSNLKRRFYLSASYTGCTTDQAWLVVKDLDTSNGCTQYDPYSGVTLPFIKYISGTTKGTMYSGKTTTLSGYSLQVNSVLNSHLFSPEFGCIYQLSFLNITV